MYGISILGDPNDVERPCSGAGDRYGIYRNGDDGAPEKPNALKAYAAERR